MFSWGVSYSEAAITADLGVKQLRLKAGFRGLSKGIGPWRSLASALAWGARGPEFKSRRPDQSNLHQTLPIFLVTFTCSRTIPQFKDGKIADDHPVPCQVLGTEAGAAEISLAENAVRRAPCGERMHPADEFEAFRELVDKDTPVEDIAARFGVTPRTVEQRLKLVAISAWLHL